MRWRNRVLANPNFQRFAAKLPLIRRIARARARQVFDLAAGFTYSQILLAAVETDVLDLLATGANNLGSIAGRAGLTPDAASCLIRAMTALNLAEEVAPGEWMLGHHGAVVQADRGVQAMIRHHRLLYADLSDPVALLRADRQRDTALSEFWTYARGSSAEGKPVTPYSELMGSSQGMIAHEVLSAYDFSRHSAVLDVGGGYGAFAAALAAAHPELRLGIFDLPEVADEAAGRAGSAAVGSIAPHAGDFFRDPLPTGYDCITLIRILHDHDDARALRLLSAARRALPRGGRLVIAEPMENTPGAEAMGAYFGIYLWTMGSGRPRPAGELGHMIETAGFSGWTIRATTQPLLARIVVAHV